MCNWYPNLVFGLVLSIKKLFPVLSTKGVYSLDYINANEIKVINALGVVVYDEKVNGSITGSKNIDLSSFTNGICFITVAKDKGAYNHKVVLIYR